MPNRLINEKSQYLLQHSNNPVDWFPWGDEAFAKAAEDNKPVFLSIGYSACHWCHVMERESFEDEDVADYLNQYFIAVKVDREERPDIDSVYTRVCQMMTGGGGWPMTIIMTPEKKPFFAGTYFPKITKMNRPGLLDILTRVADLWQNEQDDIIDSAENITKQLRSETPAILGEDIGPATLHTAIEQFARSYDNEYGGFGSAPKFPTPYNLIYLLRYSHFSSNEHSQNMALETLKKMYAGGIYDHIGFGFHRYSTDKKWLLPHFEKMLYDQAMLMLAYTEAYKKTKDTFYLNVIDEIYRYVSRDLRSPEGAFYSAEDADSDGVEGKFYIWHQSEIESLLGNDAPLFIEAYSIKDDGNFQDPLNAEYTGENILHIAASPEELAFHRGTTVENINDSLDKCRSVLFTERQKRVKPLRDEKILTDWNGLMIAALAYAGAATNNQKYVIAAESAANFLLEKLSPAETKLMHRYKDGEAAITGMLEDYAFFIWGLIELYTATHKAIYLVRAIGFTNQVIKHFNDSIYGGFYFTADYGEELLTRQKEIYDGAIPSGNSIMFHNLLRIGRLTAADKLINEAEMIIRSFSEIVKKTPSAFTCFLSGMFYLINKVHEVVVAGDPNNPETRTALEILRACYQPNMTIFLRDPKLKDSFLQLIAPHTENMIPADDDPIFYLCHNFECEYPTGDIAALLERL